MNRTQQVSPRARRARWDRRWLTGAVIALWVVGLWTVGVSAHSPVTLTYWHFYSGHIGQMHARLVDEFNRLHPDIQVQATYGGTPWTMRDKLAAALAAGAGPDVAGVDQFWISELAAAGYAVSVEPWLKAEPSFMADMIPVFWETARYGGRIWSVPFAVSNVLLYYNIDLLEQLGFGEKNVPATWDEFVELGAHLREAIAAANVGPAWVLDVPTTAHTGVAYYFLITLWQHGGDLFSEDGARVTIDSEAARRTLRLWQELVDSGLLDLQRPDRVWEAGRAVFHIHSSARIRATYGQLPFPFGVAPLPRAEFRVTGIGGRNLAILTRDPEKQQAAWTFIRWLTGPDVNTQWSAATGYSPLRRSTYSSTAFQKEIEEEPKLATALHEMMYARARPNIPVYAEASRLLGEAVEGALFHRLDPEPVLSALSADIAALMERTGTGDEGTSGTGAGAAKRGDER